MTRSRASPDDLLARNPRVMYLRGRAVTPGVSSSISPGPVSSAISSRETSSDTLTSTVPQSSAHALPQAMMLPPQSSISSDATPAITSEINAPVTSVVTSIVVSSTETSLSIFKAQAAPLPGSSVGSSDSPLPLAPSSVVGSASPQATSSVVVTALALQTATSASIPLNTLSTGLFVPSTIMQTASVNATSVFENVISLASISYSMSLESAASAAAASITSMLISESQSELVTTLPNGVTTTFDIGSLLSGLRQTETASSSTGLPSGSDKTFKQDKAAVVTVSTLAGLGVVSFIVLVVTSYLRHRRLRRQDTETAEAAAQANADADDFPQSPDFIPDFSTNHLKASESFRDMAASSMVGYPHDGLTRNPLDRVNTIEEDPGWRSRLRRGLTRCTTGGIAGVGVVHDNEGYSNSEESSTLPNRTQTLRYRGASSIGQNNDPSEFSINHNAGDGETLSRYNSLTTPSWSSPHYFDSPSELKVSKSHTRLPDHLGTASQKRTLSAVPTEVSRYSEDIVSQEPASFVRPVPRYSYSVALRRPS
ncbi:hypothetical protein SISSUDRAFT_1046517 [Sistotremastrum suecicum HHB10207 ss-3]|uniref:Uncharacterized protein n=1 Tax=Sistotremastrum suecicum HHB10207 ss-3 TaxID=1314776 RepID=A0A166DPT9_9AGAM|nr:hypothetical protein SISSUDRAFT_1046517 [Sistotremastrum suecicum HHB10207 ss-3]